MDNIRIPHNGLPQEVTSIPMGQVVILTNPYLGVTAKTIHMMEFILSMAKDYKQSHNINTRTVQYSGLWGCFACKVETDKGVQILLSDKDSLIEMLCEFWGLDYEEVCKTIVLKGRYKIIPYGGENHPVRVSMPAFKTPAPVAKKDDSRISLNFLQAHSRAEVYGNIRSSIIDNFNYNYGISLDDIITIYKEEEKNRKTYTLDIHIERKEVYVKAKPVMKIKDCEFRLYDNFGKEYVFDPPVKSKAIYLTFIMFPGGLSIKQVSGNKRFYQIFKEIFLQLPYSSMTNLPKNFNGLSNTESTPYTLFLQQLGYIRDAIMDATNDNSARELFAVEGNAELPFKVAGATDEIREKIKKEFDLK